MFDVSRILAIPDLDSDHVQCGISGVERAELKDRGFVRVDGTKAKDSMIRTIKKSEKVGIKGDKPMPSKPVKQREYTAGADMAKKRIQSLAKQSNELRSQADELQGKILKAQNTKANRYAKGALKRRDKNNPYGLEADGMGQSFTKSAQNIRAMEAERDRLTQESEKLFQKTIRLRNVWGDKIYAKEKQDSQNGVLKNAIAYYESSKPSPESVITKTPKAQSKTRPTNSESITKELVSAPNPVAATVPTKTGRDLKSRLRARVEKRERNAKNKLTGSKLKLAMTNAPANEKRAMLVQIQANTKALKKEGRDASRKRQLSGKGIYNDPIVRKKREKTARDNRLELERKGQGNLFSK